MITQKQFNDFLNEIEPSPTTKSDASEGHTRVRDQLKSDSIFKSYYVNSFLSGSYKRDTAIRPRKIKNELSRPDVDIIVETNHSLTDHPQAVIDLFYDVLMRKYTDIRKQNRSIGIKTDKVDMDIVPIIKSYGIHENLYIPDKTKEQWIITNPSKHTSWTSEVNQNSEGRFKPLVKLMKWWRRHNQTISKKPKGFVIECIVEECMDMQQSQYGELFVGTLERIVEKYAHYVLAGELPYIQDPGVPSNSVTNGMTFSAFEGFYNKAKSHAIVGREAINETDSEESIKKWRILFGERFPRSGIKNASTLLSNPITPALEFPNHPIQPKKPGGFA